MSEQQTHPHQPGRHARGPSHALRTLTMTTTLEKIMARCIDDGGCLRWQGSLSASAGHPKIKDRSGRRVVYELAYGPIPPKGLIGVKCECTDCLNPEHLTLTTKSAAAKKANASPAVRLRKAVASAKVHRARGKITFETAQEIKDSNISCDEGAERYGVDRTLISKIRRGRAWHDLTPNPFTGLGAR